MSLRIFHILNKIPVIITYGNRVLTNWTSRHWRHLAVRKANESLNGDSGPNYKNNDNGADGDNG
jgi:hypothetical protein